MGFSRRVVLVVVVVLALAGGGIAVGIVLTEGGSGSPSGTTAKARYPYPASVKSQLLSACTRHTTKSACECVVRAYEATMPYGIYHDIARGGVQANNRAYWQAFTTASSRCTS